MATKYELGSNQIPIKASESIADIPANKTLIIQQLTSDPSPVPETVENLQTMDEVFAHFKPEVELDFEKEDGSTISEKITFSNIGDFKTKSMAKKSPYLNEIASELRNYEEITKQVKTNRVLAKLLEDSNKTNAFIEILKGLEAELQDNA